VITLSRFLWLEQWRGRQCCRPQPPSPWEQWILRKRAFWAGHVTHGFWFASLRPSKCRNSRGRRPHVTPCGNSTRKPYRFSVTARCRVSAHHGQPKVVNARNNRRGGLSSLKLWVKYLEQRVSPVPGALEPRRSYPVRGRRSGCSLRHTLCSLSSERDCRVSGYADGPFLGTPEARAVREFRAFRVEHTILD
jgi:hypothetical protein